MSRFESSDLFTTLSSLYFLRHEFVFFPGVSCYCLDNSYVSGFLPSISLMLCSQLPKTVDPLYWYPLMLYHIQHDCGGNLPVFPPKPALLPNFLILVSVNGSIAYHKSLSSSSPLIRCIYLSYQVTDCLLLAKHNSTLIWCRNCYLHFQRWKLKLREVNWLAEGPKASWW